jgi:linoleoyl-CoA desaturase
MSNNHYYYYIIDTILWCSIATYSLISAINNNNFYYIVAVSFAEAKLGLIAHEACHQNNHPCPAFLCYLYDCAMGSHLKWIHQHNKHHHIYTNTDLDPDISLSPIFRIHPNHKLYEWHKYQYVYQYILFALVPISLRINGVIYLHQNGTYLDILIHYILALPATYLYIVYPISKYQLYGLLFLLSSNAILGLIYGVLFSVSHVNELVEFEPKGTHQEKQMKTTADWEVGSYFWNYVTGGLNHQVIHHMYPFKSSYEYPEIAIKMKNNLNYKRMGSLYDAILSNAKYMYKMGNSLN